MAPDIDGLTFLIEFFKNQTYGYLIDVGAYDGVSGSQTQFLLDKGWFGVLIEPLPMAYHKLEEKYKNRPGIVTLPVACSNKEGTAILYPHKGCTTMDPAWRDACALRFSHVKYGEPFKVLKTPLKHILNTYEAPSKIDFLQIDTEGHDLFVLKGMDWERKPTVVCVESLDMRHLERKQKGFWKPNPELVSFMNSVGYYCNKLTKGGNAFFLRKDST